VTPSLVGRYNQSYLDSLLDLYYDGGLISALSAGRVGGEGEGSVSILTNDLITSGDWVTGRGLGSYLPLDSAFLEYFYQGGIFALAGYVAALVILSFIAWRDRRSEIGKLLIFVVAYVWIASIGGPTLTASRANVSLVMLISSCLAARLVRQSAADAQRNGDWGISASLSDKPDHRLSGAL